MNPSEQELGTGPSKLLPKSCLSLSELVLQAAEACVAELNYPNMAPEMLIIVERHMLRLIIDAGSR